MLLLLVMAMTLYLLSYIVIQGVSEKLGTLIEGESLLNDGSAIVVFEVFLGETYIRDSKFLFQQIGRQFLRSAVKWWTNQLGITCTWRRNRIMRVITTVRCKGRS